MKIEQYKFLNLFIYLLIQINGQDCPRCNIIYTYITSLGSSKLLTKKPDFVFLNNKRTVTARKITLFYKIQVF